MWWVWVLAWVGGCCLFRVAVAVHVAINPGVASPACPEQPAVRDVCGGQHPLRLRQRDAGRGVSWERGQYPGCLKAMPGSAENAEGPEQLYLPTFF